MKAVDAEWFEKWFGNEYVALYPHRNETEAETAVGLIASTLESRTIRRVLDLACGLGRHSRYLGQRWWTSGVDLSEVLLRIARRNGTPAQLVRADIRALPYRAAAFDLVVNLFTSFGYFDTDVEHEQVIRDVFNLVTSGGTFVLDYLNAACVSVHLVPFDQSVIGGRKVEQRREISADGRYVVKHIEMKDEGKEFIERVRLFTHRELCSLLERAGFRIETTFGDYDGSAYGESSSPRAILFARRD
jgi:SAM-dependent methyltransferase